MVSSRNFNRNAPVPPALRWRRVGRVAVRRRRALRSPPFCRRFSLRRRRLGAVPPHGHLQRRVAFPRLVSMLVATAAPVLARALLSPAGALLAFRCGRLFPAVSGARLAAKKSMRRCRR